MTGNVLKAVSGSIPNWFAVTMGIGTVFVGLIAIIIICVVVGKICSNDKAEKQNTVKTTGTEQNSGEREQIIAAVCAALAEEMGKDVNSLRVVSFKKL